MKRNTQVGRARVGKVTVNKQFVMHCLSQTRQTWQEEAATLWVQSNNLLHYQSVMAKFCQFNSLTGKLLIILNYPSFIINIIIYTLLLESMPLKGRLRLRTLYLICQLLALPCIRWGRANYNLCMESSTQSAPCYLSVLQTFWCSVVRLSGYPSKFIYSH